MTRSADAGHDREVVIVCPDLAGNAVGRSLVFADILRGVRRVTVVGWSSGPVHPLAVDRGVAIERVRSGIVPPAALRRRLANATVVATKPLFRSFGWALAARADVILDIDDPELALATADLRTIVSTSVKPISPVITAVLQAVRHRAKAVTVSGEVLRGRFGGVIVPHAREAARFDAHTRDRVVARRALGLPAREPLVVFVGTLRRHKGSGTIGTLADALPHVTFAIVGDAAGAGASTARANLRFVPRLAYDAALRWVAAADVVLVPQARTRVGNAQVPAKLVDAMAMGRAVVATDLAPIRETCGPSAFLVPASDAAFVEAVRAVLDDDRLREDLEREARARFERLLSTDAVRPRVLDLLARVECPGCS